MLNVHSVLPSRHSTCVTSATLWCCEPRCLACKLCYPSVLFPLYAIPSLMLRVVTAGHPQASCSQVCGLNGCCKPLTPMLVSGLLHSMAATPLSPQTSTTLYCTQLHASRPGLAAMQLEKHFLRREALEDQTTGDGSGVLLQDSLVVTNTHI